MQEVFWHFFIGFVVSFLGSLPIGTVNLAVIQTTVNSNFKSGFYFSLGAAIIELIYIAFAIKLIAYIYQNKVTHANTTTDLDLIIQLISIPVFFVLAILYLRKGEPDHHVEVRKGKSFYSGLLIGIVNPLQIPFWIAYGTYLLTNDWIKNDATLINVFIGGISVGTLFVLTLIAFVSKKLVSLFELKTTLVNRFIAAVLIVLAIYQIIKISLQFIEN